MCPRRWYLGSVGSTASDSISWISLLPAGLILGQCAPLSIERKTPSSVPATRTFASEAPPSARAPTVRASPAGSSTSPAVAADEQPAVWMVPQRIGRRQQMLACPAASTSIFFMTRSSRLPIRASRFQLLPPSGDSYTHPLAAPRYRCAWSAGPPQRRARSRRPAQTETTKQRGPQGKPAPEPGQSKMCMSVGVCNSMLLSHPVASYF